MGHTFDQDKAREALQKREADEKERLESERAALLNLAVTTLRDLFAGTDVSVYLVGSVTQPGAFSARSDVDIVLKNFTGDRFELWPQLETLLNRNVEVILFEDCHFQEHVIAEGLKVL